MVANARKKKKNIAESITKGILQTPDNDTFTFNSFLSVLLRGFPNHFFLFFA